VSKLVPVNLDLGPSFNKKTEKGKKWILGYGLKLLSFKK
jgi:hypothetical protein